MRRGRVGQVLMPSLLLPLLLGVRLRSGFLEESVSRRRLLMRSFSSETGQGKMSLQVS